MRDWNKAITDMAPGLQQAIFILFLLVGMAALRAAYKWDGHLYKPEGCHEIQEVQGLSYMVNTCDGTHELLKKE